MYDACDILPILALQPSETDDILIHYENELPGGHDLRQDSKNLTRYRKYFQQMPNYNLNCNTFQIPWRKGHQFYKKFIREGGIDFTTVGKDQIYFNPMGVLSGDQPIRNVSLDYSDPNNLNAANSNHVIVRNADRNNDWDDLDQSSRSENAYNSNFDYKFKKVFLEAPCNFDRKALTMQEQAYNMYHYAQRPLRANLPQIIEKMLVCAVLNADENGGEIVYSTRTLNPVHNEFMIQFALESLRVEYGIAVEPVKLDILKKGFEDHFEFENSVDLGILAVPTLRKNWGPRYVCKLRRLAAKASHPDFGSVYGSSSEVVSEQFVDNIQEKNPRDLNFALGEEWSDEIDDYDGFYSNSDPDNEGPIHNR